MKRNFTEALNEKGNEEKHGVQKRYREIKGTGMQSRYDI